MQDSLNVENTLARYHREHDLSGTTLASFPAKFEATKNKLGQKKQHHSVYIYIYIYIYIHIYIYCMVNILERKLKLFAHEELDNLL